MSSARWSRLGMGGEPVRNPIIPDNLDELEKTILNSLDKGDLIVVNAGASAGSEMGKILCEG